MAKRRPQGGITVFASDGTPVIGSPSRQVIGGRLHHPLTGHPLAGLTVAASLNTARGSPTVVGTSRSDAAGRFTVVATSNDAALALRQVRTQGVTLVVHVTAPDGGEWFSTGDVGASFGSASLVLPVPVPPAQPTADHWSILAERLQERRQIRLHEAVRHLVLAPAEESVIGDWAVELRHALAIALERALLDPSGVLSERGAPPMFFGVHARGEWAAYRQRVRLPGDSAVTVALDRAAGLYEAYPGIYRVDWEIDLGALGDGAVTTAVAKFEDNYNAGVAETPKAVPIPKSPLTPYRDYLRTLFTGADFSSTESQAKREALERRFHQDFTTTDGQRRSANSIVTSILKVILTAPEDDGYGFGITPASIEAKGSRSDREYLDHLIDRSGLTADELGRRYRLDLGRTDSEQSTPVEENIATLQGFYRDGYQSKKDPFPIFPDATHGKAPFFLYYDEWLRRTGPFYPENLYRIDDTFTCGVQPEWLAEAKTEAGSNPHKGWWLKTVTAQELLAQGHDKMRQGQFRIALEKYLEAWRLGYEALEESVEVLAEQTGGTDSDVWQQVKMSVPPLGVELRGLPLASEADLAYFVERVRWSGEYPTYEDPLMPTLWFPDWIEDKISHRWLALKRLTAFVAPACVAEACSATGDYASAVYLYSLGTRRFLGRGPTDIVPPYRSPSSDKFGDYDSHLLWRYGPLPYTVDTSASPDEGWVPSAEPGLAGGDSSVQQRAAYIADDLHDDVLHDMERRWFKLRQAEALVHWADALYRTDEAENVQRARELYKSALFVLGASPGITPFWGETPFYFGNGTENPAVIALRNQAKKGMAQIDAGLNYYGADDSLVPHLRYRTLKEAADRYASAAKSAETDLLAYTGNIENALVEQMMHANLLKKASLQAAIAGEQAEIAEFEVALAQRQVAAIKAEIERKKQELEDESGFFEQFKDVVVGMKDTIVGLPSGLTGFAATGAEATAGAGGASLSGSAALAAGAGVMAGYGIFLYAGVTSLAAVSDSLTSLKQQVKALVNDALPLAEAQVQARQRQVTIANLQRQIAQADVELARELIHFAQVRFLNVDFWSELAAVARRTLRRYLTLGGRYAWLAERALAYEQDRPLNIVRLDYIPVKHQGITGAAQLVADLVELDVARLEGLRQAIPVRHTWSVAFDFPLQFAQLKATGQCEFQTSDERLRLAHPGTYGHRIETVRLRAQNLEGVSPFRGLIRNAGRSTVARADNSTHLSLRFEDALALTEPGADGWVATPGADETLGVFEGSGVETTWLLELPAAANTYGLSDLADVLFTIEARALYSPDLYDQASPPATVTKLLAVSAAHQQPAALVALRNPEIASVDIDFDLAGLPDAETNHKVTNAFVIVAGPGDGGGSIQVKASGQPVPVAVSLVDGVASSNAGPLANGAPAEPLNMLVGLPGRQNFTLSLTKADLADIDLPNVRDVILGVEYSANLS